MPELKAINSSISDFPSLSEESVNNSELINLKKGADNQEFGVSSANEFAERLDELLQKLEAIRQLLSTHKYRKGDNARITINEYQRFSGMFGDDSVLKSREFEFYSVDHTLDDINTEDYPKFQSTFDYGSNVVPQLVLLNEILTKNGNSELVVPKTEYDRIMSFLFNEIKTEIEGPVNNQAIPGPAKPAWLYGALFDDLRPEDVEYVVDKNQTLSPGGTFYGNAELANYDEEGNRDGDRDVENDDMILGISRMEYEEKYNNSGRPNRVFYLHPDTYGGTYTKPKIYIKPVQNKGWRGFIDVIFPELSPCKPSKKNMVEFIDIQDKMSEAYTFMADDQRLREKEYCAVEVPYNRILERSGKAGIQALVQAACRIWGTTAMIKAIATFTTFSPRFPET